MKLFFQKTVFHENSFPWGIFSFGLINETGVFYKISTMGKFVFFGGGGGGAVFYRTIFLVASFGIGFLRISQGQSRNLMETLQFL